MNIRARVRATRTRAFAGHTSLTGKFLSNDPQTQFNVLNVSMAVCWTTERVLQRVTISLQRFTPTCGIPSLVRSYGANPTPKSRLKLANNPSQAHRQAFGQHIPHSSLIKGPLTSPSYSVLRHIRRCIHSSIRECLILGDWRVDEQKVVL